MSTWFVIWIVTTQVVNFAFYLAVTRVAFGWARTLGAYLIYVAALLAASAVFPQLLRGGPSLLRQCLPVWFAAFFFLWAVLTVALSRGVLGRRIFFTFVCGVHQVGAFAVSLLCMRYVRPEGLGSLCGCATMALMGWALIAKSFPCIRRMDDNAGWKLLNLSGVVNLSLLFVTGIWPTLVSEGGWEDVCHFLVANAAMIVYFPVMMSFAEKRRADAMLALVENNMRLMANEMRVRRNAIDEARRIRHDRRHHRIAVGGLLLNGQVKEALAYLKDLDSAYDETSFAKLVWCENETLNAILSGYSRRAQALGVRFSAVANIGRQGNLPDVDAVALAANLLENAILAAGPDGEVTCTFRQRRDSSGLTVTNTVPPDFRLSPEGLPCASRGVGLESVRRVLEKYHGECRYSLADGVLSCECVVFVEGEGTL